MRRDFGVSATVQSIEAFRDLTREVSSREEKLDKELQARLTMLTRQRDKANAEIRAELARKANEADKELASALEVAEVRRVRREKWIAESYKSSRGTAVKRAEDAEGRLKYRLQMDGMQARRTWETGRAAADRALAEFQAFLASEEQQIAELEEQTRMAFQGYRAFRSLLSESPQISDAEIAEDETSLGRRLTDLRSQTRDRVDAWRRRWLPALFRYTAAWCVLLLTPLLLVPVLPSMGVTGVTFPMAGVACVVGFVFAAILHRLGLNQNRSAATAIASGVMRSRGLHQICTQKATDRHTSEWARLQSDFDGTTQRVEGEWNAALSAGQGMRDSFQSAVESKRPRALATNLHHFEIAIQQARERHRDGVGRATEEAAKLEADLARRCGDTESNAREEREAQVLQFTAEWNPLAARIVEQSAETLKAANALAPAWESPEWKRWTPPSRFTQGAKLGTLQVDLARLAGALPQDARMSLPGASQLSFPLLLTYPHEGSVLFETDAGGSAAAVGALNNLVLRLLATTPPGRVSFTVIDPVGLGQNFAGVMHLADQADHVINNKIWTQADQIERKLADLNEHMEKVIQMYLRNEYETIAEYNEQAGTIAEKYHFLVVADFPAQFSESAAKRLLRIATSGARCGVYTLIHWDNRHALPPDFAAEELRRSSVCLTCQGREIALTGHRLSGTVLTLDPPPAPEQAIELIQSIGRANRDSNRVEVPFSTIAPSDDKLWSEESTSELRVPIGRTGATKLQYLAIGKGTRQHALVAGKTGSGKSTLFHVIITNLALWCSPEQVEFYLVDFKKGVEFKCYASQRLPHAKVVAIESDREFGLSVLQKLDDELRRRGDLYRRIGAQDISSYKRLAGAEPMPRVLLLIDEFQELFVEDDKVSQSASVLLDRIVRQGRAFGMHVILGSQTLGGAYTVARATLGQMVIRIALQCNEADAYLIMDDNNSAPRLLSRPGEGIYNDSAGAVAGNSPFQVVWMTDETRDEYLQKARVRADQSPGKYPGPFVYEGDAPANVQENALLADLLAQSTPTLSGIPRIWLGAPNSIKGPTELSLSRQSAKHVMIVGQREEAGLVMLSVALVALAAQHATGAAQFILFEGSAPGTPDREFIERLLHSVPNHSVTTLATSDLTEIMTQLSSELKSRSESGEAAKAPPIFVLIHELQRYKKLRNEDEFSFSSDDSGAESPAVVFGKLISEGSALGIHVLLTCDGYNNVGRFLNRKAVSEFETRVLFQMSANDSASLIDSPKASVLGMNRAVCYNDQVGSMEVFRPYATPDSQWFDHVRESLLRRTR